MTKNGANESEKTKEEKLKLIFDDLGYAGIVDVLIKAGANVDAINRDHASPIDIAKERGIHTFQ